MADKAAFSPEEWKQILGSVMLTGLAVTVADRSGLWGMMKEGIASTGALLEKRQDAEANPLVKAVIADFETSEGRSAAREQIKQVIEGAKTPEEIEARAITAIKQVSDLLGAKAKDDAPAFRSFLQDVGQKTAEAAKEGGFLGFGGVQVSDAEKAALDQIAKALAA